MGHRESAHLSAIGLLDELNGRLTAVTVKYPEIKPFIMSYQKHVQFALQNPQKAKVWKVIEKGYAWIRLVMWKHPMLRPEFEGMKSAIERFEKSRGVDIASGRDGAKISAG